MGRGGGSERKQTEGESVEKAWVEFKEGVLSTAVEVCGMKQTKTKKRGQSGGIMR